MVYQTHHPNICRMTTTKNKNTLIWAGGGHGRRRGSNRRNEIQNNKKFKE
jgi:hypothetical protein